LASPILPTARLREVEAGFSNADPPLMERAGRAIAERARTLANDTGAPILLVAGPGNNGGDAWVAAATLREGFHRVVVLDAAGTEPRAAEARAAKDRFTARGGEIVRSWPAWRPALVIDGLLGIGISREVDAPCAALIERINTAGCPVLAIDVPSGLDSDTGQVRGAAVRATHTQTFIALKPGLLTGQGPELCGHVDLDDLGLGEAARAAAPGADLATSDVRGWLGPRGRDAHKGTFGTIAIVGGNRGMVGAALLAARAALHCGAGKVYVGLLAADAPTVDLAQPELMLRPVDDALSAHVLVVGPGAGASHSTTSASMFERIVLPAVINSAKPLVIDADAINAIAVHDSLRHALSTARRAPTVLTPHPGEAARLLKSDTKAVQGDRVAAALEIAKRFHADVVLKGAGSVCASPDGQWAINTTGNPGLASGGTGDVLAGIIGALLCQGLDGARALRYGVCLHGAAADALVSRGVGPIGLTASELIPEARRLLNSWTATD
jgi:hydroxyethylthiazole kinase-like uncharacterized protein yjeF